MFLTSQPFYFHLGLLCMVKCAHENCHVIDITLNFKKTLLNVSQIWIMQTRLCVCVWAHVCDTDSVLCVCRFVVCCRRYFHFWCATETVTYLIHACNYLDLWMRCILCTYVSLCVVCCAWFVCLFLIWFTHFQSPACSITHKVFNWFFICI